MLQVQKTSYPSNTFGRYWMKVPLILRSVLVGFGVSSLGVGIWVLLVTNTPLPWSVSAMGAILIFYWMYFRGKWKPLNTQAFRRSCTRQMKLKSSVWIWGLMAACAIFLFVQSGWIFTFRIYEFQPEIFKTSSYLNDYPGWMSWSIILMASLVAGICEEIGFRGYMQAPLEKKYGPLLGISITSLVFVLVHIHQAWASGILMEIFAISFMIGYLAYSTNSLLPGIIAHVAFDIINFSYWWSDVIGTYQQKPISMTGIDSHFFISLVVVLLSIVIFAVSIRKLLKLKKKQNI
jgi:membrane protease YdiL (CAAX protease family)